MQQKTPIWEFVVDLQSYLNINTGLLKASMHQLSLLEQSGKICLLKRLSRHMKYTVKDLRVDFPDEEACLEWLINWLYPNGVTCKKCNAITKHYKDKNRRSYSCSQCGNHMHPTAGTIFHNSHVPLTDWFHAIWLMSSHKSGISAKQIEREIGVSYATAFRIMHQIRKMMDAPDELLGGEVEIDETYVHANPYKRSSVMKRYGPDARRKGYTIVGMVQRGGPVKVWRTLNNGVMSVLSLIRDNVAQGTKIYTDGYTLYKRLPGMGFEHKSTEHGKHIYVDPDDKSNYTQNIENVWSHLKRGIKGVYRKTSDKYVGLYAQEYAWRYSNRHRTSVFWALMLEIEKDFKPKLDEVDEVDKWYNSVHKELPY